MRNPLPPTRGEGGGRSQLPAGISLCWLCDRPPTHAAMAEGWSLLQAQGQHQRPRLVKHQRVLGLLATNLYNRKAGEGEVEI